MSRRLSLPFDDFPRKFQLAVKRLEAPRRGRQRYSAGSCKDVVQAFGQYLAVLKEADLELELSPEGLTAFIDNLVFTV